MFSEVYELLARQASLLEQVISLQGERDALLFSALERLAALEAGQLSRWHDQATSAVDQVSESNISSSSCESDRKVNQKALGESI